jgi:predicted DNA-binding transcriptional regulator AlpA
MNSFIRIAEVKRRTGLSASSIYKFVNNGSFPRQVKIGVHATAWVNIEIEKWILKKMASR